MTSNLRSFESETRSERIAGKRLSNDLSKFYNSPILTITDNMAKTGRKPRGKQAAIEGNGFDLPKPIQAISNAADELFDLIDEKATLRERLEKVQLNVMALMRAADRKIYKHRDRTITIDGKETLKVDKPKKPLGGGDK